MALYLWRKMDAYDWHYRRRDLLATALTYSILWPLLLLRPGLLKDPSELFRREFDLSASLAKQQREGDISRRNLPACGDRIRWSPSDVDNKASAGVFLFDNHDLRRHLEANLRENPHLSRNHEGEILRWLESHYDVQVTEPVDVPAVWHRFEYTANAVIRSGYAAVFCERCGRPVSCRELRFDDDRGKPGWNFNRISCPDDHALLVVRALHVYPG